MKNYIKGFIQYIKESDDMGVYDSHVSEIVGALMAAIKKSDVHRSSEYTKIASIERLEDPFTYDLDLIISRNPNPNFKTDSHFSNMEWEEINFKKYGFSADGNVYMDSDEDIVPEMEIVILINPTKEPECYQQLFFKLNDIVAHELHHLTQAGWNKQEFRTQPSPKEVRAQAKTGYKYFLLPDEVESMVMGMYRKAKIQMKPLDAMFDEYLGTFLEYKYITEEEYTKVITEWIKYALTHYPMAKFTNKYANIINSL